MHEDSLCNIYASQSIYNFHNLLIALRNFGGETPESQACYLCKYLTFSEGNNILIMYWLNLKSNKLLFRGLQLSFDEGFNRF